MVVHAVACPFISDTMDSLELMSLFGSFCTYFLGQFLFVETIASGWKIFISVIIGLVNFSIMMVLALIILGMASAKVKAMILNLQFIRWWFPKKKRRFQNVKKLDANDLIGVDRVPLPRVLYPHKIVIDDEKIPESNETTKINSDDDRSYSGTPPIKSPSPAN